MKKIIFASIASLLMFSCNRDDSSTTSTNSFVGSWKLTSFIIISGTDKKTLYSESNTGCAASNRDEYKTDGTITATFYDYSTGTCALKETKTGTFSYDSNNKKLTKVFNSISEVSDVYYLSSAELQILTGQTDYNNDGTQDLKLSVYTKQ